MDGISGIFPQMGWSSATAQAVAENKPATTVDSISAISDAAGGLYTSNDTQGRSSQFSEKFSISNSGERILESKFLSIAREKIDPDMPSGPPPTFEITPIESRIAELNNPDYNAKNKGDVSFSDMSFFSGTKNIENIYKNETNSEIATASTSKEWSMVDSIERERGLDLFR